MSNDPVLARRVANGEVEIPESKQTGPRMSEWSPERAALAEVADLLRQNIAAVIGVANGKPPKFTPSARPDTLLAQAIRHAKDRQVREKFAEIVAAFGLADLMDEEGLDDGA